MHLQRNHHFTLLKRPHDINVKSGNENDFMQREMCFVLFLNFGKAFKICMFKLSNTKSFKICMKQLSSVISFTEKQIAAATQA
jgi:hypothetical protein